MLLAGGWNAGALRGKESIQIVWHLTNGIQMLTLLAAICKWITPGIANNTRQDGAREWKDQIMMVWQSVAYDEIRMAMMTMRVFREMKKKM